MIDQAELQERTVAIDQICLDPDNPRWSDPQGRKTSEAKIPDADKQSRTLTRISGPSFDVPNLIRSIASNGFLPLDRIVVRPLEESDLYVVVEGNRRIAAIKILLETLDNDDYQYLDTGSERTINEDDYEALLETRATALMESLRQIDVLVYTGSDTDVSWILQGVRHLSGIREWVPAQQAHLIALQKEKGLPFAAIGAMYGLSPPTVAKRYRAYRGMQQLRENDEYGSDIKDDMYTLFELAHSDKRSRERLGWSDDSDQYENDGNLTLFYSWLFPSDGDGRDEAVIHNPATMKHFCRFLELKEEAQKTAVGRTRLQNAVDNVARGEIDLSRACDMLDADSDPTAWSAYILDAAQAIDKITAGHIEESGPQILTELGRLEAKITKLKAWCGAEADD